MFIDSMVQERIRQALAVRVYTKPPGATPG
jgi:hypothetical protein